jgi:hypothetical protein
MNCLAPDSASISKSTLLKIASGFFSTANGQNTTEKV